MQKKDFTTVAISPEGKKAARIIAGHTGESLKGLIERLIRQEVSRLATTGNSSTDTPPATDKPQG